MTNLEELERLAREARKVSENLPGIETRVAFYGGAIPSSGSWIAFKPDTILSLIQRVKEAEDGPSFDSITSMIEDAHAAGRAEGLEEAAKVAGKYFIPGHSVAGPEFAAALAETIRSLKEKK